MISFLAKSEKTFIMKRTFKRTFAALIAATTLAVGMSGMSASAQSVSNCGSTGGSYGSMYYTLSTTSYYSRNGIDFYQLKATSTQTLPYGGSYLPITAINYSACIYLESGGQSISSASYSTRDATWYSREVAETAVIDATEKGYITHNITSQYYGSITKTLTNE